MRYQIIFISGGYRSIDAEADTYEQAQEIKHELQAQMYASGERDFYYIIEPIRSEKDIDDDIFSDDDFNAVIGRY